jgi:gluconate:H+ symporter, GntP family
MPTLHPLTALAASIVLVVVLIGWCRLHAFFALLLGALAVALTTGTGTAVAGVENVLREMGALTGSIGYSIAVAAVIGAALMESGAADRIVRTFLRVLGEKHAPWALLGSGFILGVPVFFDTVFFLLIPLARALSARTGKNYLLHVMAICAGAVVTHATVPPTPGPLAMAEILKLDTGFAIMVGAAAGILPAIAGIRFARWLDARKPVPMRAAAGSTLEAVGAAAGRDEASLPGFFASIAPVVVPVVLIAAVSIGAGFRGSIGEGAWGAIAFFGNKNVALTLGALIAVGVYLKQTRRSWRDTGHVVGEPLGTAGVIILITAAGGAYGAMIRASGVGDLLRDWMSHTGASPVILAWALAALLRAAQGSTTVAVITTAGLMASLGGTEGLGVNPIFIYLAIGYGGLCLSWMNDSGFWLYSRMSGMTEGETLRSWSVLLTLISVVGLFEAWALSVMFR